MQLVVLLLILCVSLVLTQDWVYVYDTNWGSYFILFQRNETRFDFRVNSNFNETTLSGTGSSFSINDGMADAFDQWGEFSVDGSTVSFDYYIIGNEIYLYAESVDFFAQGIIQVNLDLKTAVYTMRFEAKTNFSYPVGYISEYGWDGEGWEVFGTGNGVSDNYPDLDVEPWFASTPDPYDNDDLIAEHMFYPFPGSLDWDNAKSGGFIWNSDPSFFRGWLARNWTAGESDFLILGVSLEYTDRDMERFTAAADRAHDYYVSGGLDSILALGMTEFGWTSDEINALNLCPIGNGYMWNDAFECIDITSEDEYCLNGGNRYYSAECRYCDASSFGTFCGPCECSAASLCTSDLGECYCEDENVFGEDCLPVEDCDTYSNVGYYGDGGCFTVSTASVCDAGCSSDRECFFMADGTSICGACPEGMTVDGDTDCMSFEATDGVVCDADCSEDRECVFSVDGTAICGACPEGKVVDGDFDCTEIPVSNAALISAGILGLLSLII